MSDSPPSSLLSPKRRLQLQQLQLASTSPDPPLLSSIVMANGSTPRAPMQQRASFGEEDKAAGSCGSSAPASPSLAAKVAASDADSRLSVSQRVKGLESSTKNPVIRPFQLGSPNQQTVTQSPAPGSTAASAATLLGSPVDRPYRRTALVAQAGSFETQGKPLSSPSSASAAAAIAEPLPSPLRSRRVSAPVPSPSPSHAAAVAAAANAANDRNLSARRLTAPPAFSPSASPLARLQPASPSQQQLPPSPVQLQAYQPRFHPYAEKALQSTVSLLSAAAIASVGAADSLPAAAAASAGLGARAASASPAQPCSSPSSSTQPAAAAATATARAAAPFFSATSLVNLKPQHVPICCARHGSLLFLAQIPAPPAYRACDKIVLAPEKANTVPKLPLWALAAAAAVHPSSAEAVATAEATTPSAASIGAHTRYPSGPSISAWIAEASAAAALNPLPLHRASTSSSATPRSVPPPSSAGSSGGGSGGTGSVAGEAFQLQQLQFPLHLAQWQQVQSQSQSPSPSPGPPALPRASGLSVQVQSTPTPPTLQRNLCAGAEVMPLGSPLSSCSSGNGATASSLSSATPPPPQHRLPASFHAQTAIAPFSFNGSAGTAGSVRALVATAGGSNASPTPRSSPRATPASAHSSSAPYTGLQYPPVSPGDNLRPPVLALEYTAGATTASSGAAASATPPPPAATAASMSAHVNRIASLRMTFESSSPSPLARQQQPSAHQAVPTGSPHPASTPVGSPPPPAIPSFTPRARAVSAGYTQLQLQQSQSQSPSPHANASSALGPPLVAASPVPPPLPPFVPRDRPGSSGGGRAERAPLLGSSAGVTVVSSPEVSISSRTALLGAADSDQRSASASASASASPSPSPAASVGSRSGHASGPLSMSPSPSPSPSPTPSPSVSPPLLPPIPASFGSRASSANGLRSSLGSGSSAASAAQTHAQLASLQQQLIDAVQLQHFEACIGLRDRIRAIEEELAREA